ncbi:MAG TPA: 50S ribosomal protein L6 [Thermoplasmata archaeon]|nr:50S ribosomal protein L6 [Thermoplasmata archaeon]
MSTDTGAVRVATTVAIPAGVSVAAPAEMITVKGPLGVISRPFPGGALSLQVQGETATLTLRLPPNRKRAKALLNTWEAHLRNLIVGVTSGFEARLKVVAAHFPMRVSVKDSDLLVENFLGEKYPRTAALPPGVTALVEGDIVRLEGIDIEMVGRCAASIERTTRIRDYDPRVFQDGIYIVDHPRPKEA